MVSFLVIIDGLGDRKIKELGDKTPLEKAQTPNLDFFAKNGSNGNVITVKKGLAPESDVAVMALLGFDPFKFHTGRGPIECFGLGLKVSNGELALRGNFSTVDEDVLLDRRVGRTLSTKEAKALEKEINKKVKIDEKFIFKASTEHRCVLLLKGKNLSAEISNTDPFYERVKGLGAAKKNPRMDLQLAKPLNKSISSKYSADLVNDFVFKAHKVMAVSKVNIKRLEKGLLPANFLLFRDAGNHLPSFSADKKLIGWFGVTEMPLEIGMSELAGMQVLSYKYPEIHSQSNPYFNLHEKLKCEINNAKKLISKNYNKAKGFYIHFKPTDVCGHDGNFNKKIEFIELLDKEFFSWLKEFMDSDKDKLAITADHATPCSLKGHSDDSVPLIVFGNGFKSDKMKRFVENNSGSLRTIKGIEVIRLIR